jgi:protein TonB
LIDSWFTDMQTAEAPGWVATSPEDFEMTVEFSNEPFDECPPMPWLKQVSIFADRKIWSSLALVLCLHSAFACLLWFSPKPQSQGHKWIEVQLVSMNGEADAAGPGPGEIGPAREESQESPKLTSPLETLPPEKNIDRRPPVPVKKEVRPLPPQHKEKITTARLQPADTGSPGHLDAASQGSGITAGTGSGAAASSGAESPGTGRGAGGSGPVERAFGSPDGPRFLHRVVPSYPALAKRLEKQGTVLLRITIDERGRPVEVEILQKAGFGLDEEAIRAVRESTFVPAKMDGKPFTCKALLPVRFVLKES